MPAPVFRPTQSYVHTMQPDASPSSLRFLLRLTGHAGQTQDGPCTYVDLGCGTGFGLILLAATNPTCRFVGMDRSSDHIAWARAFAAQVGLGNVAFHEASFESFGAKVDLAGAADIVACHGILSWIEPSEIDQVLDLAKRLLAPGGLLYCGYNSQPGWAAIEPLRATIRTLAVEDPASAVPRGFRFLRALREVEGSAVHDNPRLIDWLERFDDAPEGYLAHEYLAGSGRAFWHGEVAAILEDRGLSFLCGSQVADGLDRLRLSPALNALLAEAGPGVARRHLRDIAVDRSFATDVFTNGRQKLDAARAEAALDEVRLVSHCPPGLLSEQDGEAPSDLRRRMIEACGEGGTSFGRIADRAESRAIGRGVVMGLVADGLLRVAATGVDGAALAAAAAFNTAALSDIETCPNLACPEVGGGLVLTPSIRAILADPGHPDRGWLRVKVPGL